MNTRVDYRTALLLARRTAHLGRASDHAGTFDRGRCQSSATPRRCLRSAIARGLRSWRVPRTMALACLAAVRPPGLGADPIVVGPDGGYVGSSDRGDTMARHTGSASRLGEQFPRRDDSPADPAGTAVGSGATRRQASGATSPSRSVSTSFATTTRASRVSRRIPSRRACTPPGSASRRPHVAGRDVVLQRQRAALTAPLAPAVTVAPAHGVDPPARPGRCRSRTSPAGR